MTTLNWDFDTSPEYYENIILSNNEFYSLLALNTILEKKLIKDDQKILNYFSQLEKKSSSSSNYNYFTTFFCNF